VNIKFYFISFLVLKYLKYIYREYVLKTPCSIDYRSPSLLWKINFSSLSLSLSPPGLSFQLINGIHCCHVFPGSVLLEFMVTFCAWRLVQRINLAVVLPWFDPSSSSITIVALPLLTLYFSLLSWWTYMSS